MTTATTTRLLRWRAQGKGFVVSEVALLVGLYAIYTLARNSVGERIAFADDFAHKLYSLESVLAMDFEPAVNHWVTSTGWVAIPLCFWYASLHYVVTPTVLVLVARRRRDLYSVARTTLIVTTLIALALYWLLPTTPPRLLGWPFLDTMAAYDDWGWWGLQGSTPGPAQWSNQYAAFPSMHAGWSFWVAIMLMKIYPRGWQSHLGWLYFAGTSLVVVGTGNHYVLDIVAGAAVIVIAYLLVTRVAARWSAHRLIAASRIDVTDRADAAAATDVASPTQGRDTLEGAGRWSEPPSRDDDPPGGRPLAT